jgi:hypothetical protein
MHQGKSIRSVIEYWPKKETARTHVSMRPGGYENLFS